MTLQKISLKIGLKEKFNEDFILYLSVKVKTNGLRLNFLMGFKPFNLLFIYTYIFILFY